MNTELPPSPSATPFETLRAVLDEIGWGSEPDESSRGFYVDFGGSHLPVADAVLFLTSGPDRFVCHFHVGADVPLERRDEVCRFVARANWGLCSGHFDLDLDHGYVRFATGFDFTGTFLDPVMVRRAILTAIQVVEIYGDQLVEVMAHAKNAAEAVSEAENKAFN